MTFAGFDVEGQAFGLTPDEAFAVVYELRSPRAIYSPEHQQLADRITLGMREGSTLSTSDDECRLLIDAIAGMDDSKRTDAMSTLREQMLKSLAHS